MGDRPIAFIDLPAQRRHLGERIDRAVLSVVDSGQYIFGPEVKRLEEALATFCGAPIALGCANGTDAIALSLMAIGLRPGDAVICPSFTFASTAEAVAWLGATPVFAEIDERTYNIDPARLGEALASARQNGLTPRALIAVDLFGQPADYAPIEAFCKENDLILVCDTAQGFGGDYRGRRTGSIGHFATTSFFPAKPLGCYGDGGAIFTADAAMAERLDSLRWHGKGADRYDNVRIGMNSRLDTIQAAILLEKLAVYEEEIAKRQIVAGRYDDGLSDVAVTPHVLDGCVSVWAQYTIRVPASSRAAFVETLKGKGVPTAIYYPKPLHRQTAYGRYPVAGNGLPVSERVADEVVSLPMHPYLDEATQNFIIETARDALAAG